MTDVFSRRKRSEIMSFISGRDTTPERIVRSLLHKQGYRFSLHRADLPGKPDITLARYGIVVFVNGCFWHDHQGCKRSTKPTTNKSFWSKKIESNRLRDKRTKRDLHRLGWRVMTIWECETRNSDGLLRKVQRFFAR